MLPKAGSLFVGVAVRGEVYLEELVGYDSSLGRCVHYGPCQSGHTV